MRAAATDATETAARDGLARRPAAACAEEAVAAGLRDVEQSPRSHRRGARYADVFDATAAASAC